MFHLSPAEDPLALCVCASQHPALLDLALLVLHLLLVRSLLPAQVVRQLQLVVDHLALTFHLVDSLFHGFDRLRGFPCVVNVALAPPLDLELLLHVCCLQSLVGIAVLLPGRTHFENH